MSNSGTLYQYVPLTAPTSIRLLRLFPSSSQSAPLEITLTEVDLDGGPQYEALSYAWGDKKEKAAILCHGKTIEVTPNCESALRQLRLATKPRSLWIDVLCIDQSSLNERNHQVSMMGNIYSAATRVIVWLGNGTLLSRVVINLLELCGSELRKADEVTRIRISDQVYMQLPGTDTEINHRSIFDEFLTKSWFSRVWTLQEVALAREALVVCGDATIPWDTFVLAVNYLENAENRVTGKMLGITALSSVMHAHVFAAEAFSQKQANWQSANADRVLSLTLVFSSALFRKCMDPKDHIFGLHAVLNRMGAGLPDPDYGKPLHHVFTEASRLVIGRDHNLDLLKYVTGLDLKENWPSWVPTWAETKLPLMLKEFRAAGDSAPLFRFRETGRQLVLRGKKIGSVSMFSARSPYLGSPHRTADEVQRFSYLDKCHEVQNVIQSFQTWVVLWNSAKCWGSMTAYDDPDMERRALFYTLLQGMMIDSGAHDETALWKGFHKWGAMLCANLKGHLIGMDAIDLLLSGHRSAHKELLPPEVQYLTRTEEWRIHEAIEKDVDTSPFHNLLLQCNMSKTLFVTDTGHIGTAVASIQAHDSIILISGLGCPLIVREIPGQISYRLMGPAFIAGIMHGEMWDGIKGRLEDIVLV